LKMQKLIDLSGRDITTKQTVNCKSKCFQNDTQNCLFKVKTKQKGTAVSIIRCFICTLHQILLE